ncbi:MAG: ROK family protein [Propionibacteriaceae bacterium]|nr:ROK family protein [Propionibacteriaceae bacterium]
MIQSGRSDDLATTVIDLVSSGQASSRRDLIARLRLAPATANLIVRRLIAEGVLVEEGKGPSTGGRPPRLLRVAEQPGVVACAELGARHARLALVTSAGALLCHDEIPLEIAQGADAVFDALARTWQQMLADSDREMCSVAVAFPGPVDVDRGVVVSPARMPGWAGVNPKSALEDRFGVPAVIENDARAGALGEAWVRHGEIDTFIYVKAGMGIGGAWVAGGQLYRGPHGLGGELTHNQLPGVVKEEGCGCGNRGCLELVASGAALSRDLAAQGLSVTGTKDLTDLAQGGNPLVSTMLRTAGSRLGEVLAPLVNFLNPSGIIIGGGLSPSDAFVAAVRGALYDRCLPMCTQGLLIEASAAGPDAAVIGLGELARHPLRLGRAVR